jgi:hypothetical protein
VIVQADRIEIPLNRPSFHGSIGFDSPGGVAATGGRKEVRSSLAASGGITYSMDNLRG